MWRLFVLGLLLILISCTDSTGPVNIDNSYLTIIDTSTGLVEAIIELNALNGDMCVTSDGSFAYIVDIQGFSGMSVMQIDCNSYSIAGGIDLGWFCQDLCLSDQETELYVLVSYYVYVVDIPSLTLSDSIALHQEPAMNILHRPGTDLVYVTHSMPSSVSIIDIQQGIVIDSLALSFDAFVEPVFSHSGDALYMVSNSSIYRIDPDTGQEMASVDVGECIASMCMDSGSNTLYATWGVVGSFIEGGIIALDGTTLSQTGSIDLMIRSGVLCHVPVLNQLYVDISTSYFNCAIAVVDLPGLTPALEMDITPRVVSMASDASGNHVFCSIHANNETDSEF